MAEPEPDSDPLPSLSNVMYLECRLDTDHGEDESVVWFNRMQHPIRD